MKKLLSSSKENFNMKSESEKQIQQEIALLALRLQTQKQPRECKIRKNAKSDVIPEAYKL